MSTPQEEPLQSASSHYAPFRGEVVANDTDMEFPLAPPFLDEIADLHLTFNDVINHFLVPGIVQARIVLPLTQVFFTVSLDRGQIDIQGR